VCYEFHFARHEEHKNTKIEEQKGEKNFTLLPWLCANIGYVIGIAYDMFKSVASGAFLNC